VQNRLKAYDIAPWVGTHRIRVDLGGTVIEEESDFRSIQKLRVATGDEQEHRYDQ
jgi:hypothetical protein